MVCTKTYTHPETREVYYWYDDDGGFWANGRGEYWDEEWNRRAAPDNL